ncbi:branched-chain amino acid transport system permease protein [Tamaricihabitans halophyticus]|uniref:Branched-chain amino acid transport system permease protein n=1 Tax=Tamaricihabitans halophyticus TaxID=1262583 RepID=A0A4R2QL99_9PSEU|nr:branched-chain amino acid ABC transporter permease [Tamaricihabitans halophyticus]TCP47811.1 branched-chain amino acid transport system permease protein [Tamaricihabitans halophyticus]
MDSGRSGSRRLAIRLLLLLAIGLLSAILPATSAAAQDSEQNTESVGGTIRGPDTEPIPDIQVMVTKNGAPIGEDTTDAEGTWEIPLPEPGSYDVAIDPDSLPDSAVPREQGGERLTDVQITPGQQRIVIFPLVNPNEQSDGDEQQGSTPTPQQTGPSFGQRFADALLSGIEYGSVIAICAVGLSLIFGTTKLINFAHGELVTIGAMVAFFLNAAAAGPGIQLIFAAILAVVAGALLGGLLERGLWRPLRHRGTGRINLFIISIGLSLLLRHVILIIHGSRPGSYTDYNIQEQLEFGPFSAAPRDLSILAIALLTLVGVATMLQRTRIGTAIRAVSDDRDLAETSGIDVSRVVLTVWILGGGLAALGGVLFGLAEVVAWDMGFKLLLLMFAAIILGGLGSAYGAMVGSFAVGIVAHLSTLWFPVELQNAWALLVLIVVLLVRPQGILGRKERVG